MGLPDSTGGSSTPVSAPRPAPCRNGTEPGPPTVGPGCRALGGFPVSGSPVASSSQMAARSLAAPPVRPLLSCSAPSARSWKPALTSPNRDVNRARRAVAGSPAAGSPTAPPRAGAGATGAGSRRRSAQALRPPKSVFDSSTTVKGASTPGRTSRRPAGNPGPTGSSSAARSSGPG